MNVMRLTFTGLIENESFARVAVAAFVAQLDPTLEELTEIKTVVSEAVSNAIIHAYPGRVGDVSLVCKIVGDKVELMIEDHGVGIEDIELARTPLFTTREDLERSGMGFTIMESFVDDLRVRSRVGEGTTVFAVKQLTSVHSAAKFEV